MGNSQVEQNPDVFGTLEQHYQRMQPDHRGIVLQDRKNHNSYLLKEYTFGNEASFKSKERALKAEVEKGIREYVVSVVRVESKVFSSFCSTNFKIYAIFQYPQVTLKQEIMARQKQNKSFEQTQLWSILQSCTNALSELSPLVSLNPHEIFINPDGHLKIIHDDLVDQNYRAVLSENIYYAPQKLKYFNKIDSDLTLRKQSVFSMGMTLLEASQLSEIQSCYNFTDCYFSEPAMFEMLEMLTEKYSPQFVEVLSNILEPNPNRRASLMEVQKTLDSYWSLEESQQSTERFYEESKGNTELAQIDNQSHFSPLPLNEKCMNIEIVEEVNKKSARKSLLRQKQMELPGKKPEYKLEQPSTPRPPEDFMILSTPKNPTTINENTLYTDPKLLQMIRKDLDDISKLKQSAFCQTTKYNFMYPQTEHILNSIKNFQSEPKPISQNIQQFRMEETPRESMQRGDRMNPSKVMMKKNHQKELVFTVQSYEDGRRYEGTTLNNRKHGKGKLIFEDGAYYEGQFADDKMNGKGILFYSQSQPAYDGEWCNDQFHGRGILYNERPQDLTTQYDFQDMSQVEDYWLRYQGQFYYDNKQGEGVLLLTNGQSFEGQFLDDLISGRGRYICLDGMVVEGEWDSNILVHVNQQ